eukprot:SAG31_NODE_1452_length_8286_cov_6.329547_1_plen_142_part_00
MPYMYGHWHCACALLNLNLVLKQLLATAHSSTGSTGRYAAGPRGAGTGGHHQTSPPPSPTLSPHGRSLAQHHGRRGGGAGGRRRGCHPRVQDDLRGVLAASCFACSSSADDPQPSQTDLARTWHRWLPRGAATASSRSGTP